MTSTTRSILGIVVLASTLLAVSPAPAGLPAPGGLIVFESDRGGQVDLWVVNPDGSNLRRLTNDRTEDIFAEWSPDGSKIAWTRGGFGPESELWIMNADGSGRFRVTFDQFSERGVTWSPDGKRLAYLSRRGGNTDIYAIDVDGTNERRLTEHPATDIAPNWSPGGGTIAFGRIGQTCNVMSMRVDGSAERTLTPDSLLAGVPVYSPSGAHIAFAEAFCSFGESDVFVMRPEGGDVQQVTDTPENEIADTWSPDGTRTAVNLAVLYKNQLQQEDLAIVDMATGAVTNITRTRDVNEVHPDWSPAL